MNEDQIRNHELDRHLDSLYEIPLCPDHDLIRDQRIQQSWDEYEALRMKRDMKQALDEFKTIQAQVIGGTVDYTEAGGVLIEHIALVIAAVGKLK